MEEEALSLPGNVEKDLSVQCFLCRPCLVYVQMPPYHISGYYSYSPYISVSGEETEVLYISLELKFHNSSNQALEWILSLSWD